MSQAVWNAETECLPLDKLVELCQAKLIESRVIEKAARSVLYRDKWAAAGVKPEKVRTIHDLAQLPYLTGSELRRVQSEYAPDEWVCSDQVRLWISTSGTTGTPKWVPIGEGDIAQFRDSIAKLATLIVGSLEDWSVLYIGGSAPFISESGGYILLANQILDDRRGEFAFVAMPESLDALTFARIAKLEGVFLAPSLAVLIAEGVSANAAPGAREQFKKEKTLKNLLGVLATSVMKIKAKNVFNFKWGAFGGEPVDPYRSAILDHYGFRPHSAYGATELLYSCPVVECSEHSGMHIYLDVSVPELIVKEELEREQADPSYVPRAVPIWETSPGTLGELVLTTFADALPLIRYRMSDLVQVISTEPCACGRTHPRIKILYRSDDMVSLGLIRFSIYLLKDKLEEVGQHGEIAKWQLRVTREGTKPKAVLVVEPRGRVDKEAFAQELADKLDEMEGMRQAWENNLIARPEVRLVDELEEHRSTLGKVKLLIYEDAYLGEA
jgi:phenylacetate-CoA ligase